MLAIQENMWVLYKNKIPVDKVKLDNEIPQMNPAGVKYQQWWKIRKRRCIEGYWAEHNGEYKFISGPLYYYVNFHKILLTPKNSSSKIKRLGIPLLRDLEWLKSFVYEEARGFSGFQNDDDYSCHEIFTVANPTTEPDKFNEYLLEYNNTQNIMASITKLDGSFKTYIPAREYLRKYFTKELGKPLYYNMAHNVVDMESRGGGKSYFGAGMIVHNFLFDGATDYDEYLDFKAKEEPLSSETLIGAIDTKYSNDVISKVKLGLENLAGKVTIGDIVHPSPFNKQYYGSWESGKTVTAGYDKKIGTNWEKVGTKSKIQHRSFNDNFMAANGTRPNLSLIDEVGFMYNLIAVLGQMKEAAADGTVKTGVIWVTGTGGDMTGGATEEVKQVFYSPEAFDCLAFEDEYENYKNKVGLFIPAWMTLNQFKDDLGNTDYRLALSYLNRTREKLKINAKKKKSYEDEIVSRPITHSEVFLLTNESILPVLDLKEHLDNMLSLQGDPNIDGLAGWMHIDEAGEPYFKLDASNYKPADYPVKPNIDNTGAVVIWKMPLENATYGWYVGGNDPYDFDKAPNSVSLGSILIMEKGSIHNGGIDSIVAEYTGRPSLASDFYEQCRRLLIFYKNASCLYENEKQNIKTHFKSMNSIGLLAFTPGVLKANETSKTARTRIYGQHMSIIVKDEVELYLREWLLTPIGDGKLQLHTIKSIPLLKELISYNKNGNFDRVIALMLCIILLVETRNYAVEKVKEEIKADNENFFNRKLFVQNMRRY